MREVKYLEEMTFKNRMGQTDKGNVLSFSMW